ncbi:MAG: transporter [Thiothrix sp.]|nr:MAG: transporter [Thiothrix sp.]
MLKLSNIKIQTMPRQRFLLYILPVIFLSLSACSGLTQKPSSYPSMPPSQQVWVSEFGSPELTKLVAEAMLNNPSLQASLARVEANRARAAISGAEMLPNIQANFGTDRSRSSMFGQTRTESRFTLGADISWEADLWQRATHRKRAAIADATASKEDFHAAQLLLAADIAKGWFQAVESKSQQQLANRRVESFKNTIEVISERYRAGIGEALDVHLARENLATAQARLASREQKLDAAKRTLEVLIGRYPNAELKLGRSLPKLKSTVPAGLTSGLLQRRPDILAAEQKLMASTERLRDSEANFLPKLRLTASGGTATDKLKNLLDWDNLIWSIGASLIQPIFQGGRLKAEQVLASSNNHEAIANYGQAVSNAFREVETALAAEPLLARQETHQTTANTESQQAAGLALSRYSAGLTEIITLLDTQRRSFNVESTLLETRLSQLLNRINLHLALGGSFTP